MSGSSITPLTFTNNAENARESLDKELRLPAREIAEEIIRKMKKCNNKGSISALSDLQGRLIRVLSYEGSEYEKDQKGKPLATSFSDKAENAKVIKKYEEYAKKLQSIDEADEKVCDVLAKYTDKYASSADYMTRLVKDLLNDYNTSCAKNEEKYDTINDTTRVLILKHFIRQFNWFVGIEPVSNRETKALVKKKYGTKDDAYMKIEDDIFDVLNIRAVWYDMPVGESFISAVTKLLAYIKKGGSDFEMTPELCRRLRNVIKDDKLTKSAKDGSAKLLKDCFSDDVEKVDVWWLKKPQKMIPGKEELEVLRRVVRAGMLSDDIDSGKKKTLTECFKDSKVMEHADTFKPISEIEMTPKDCECFRAIFRDGRDDEDNAYKKSDSAKKGTAKTLAECFNPMPEDDEVKIENITFLVMYACWTLAEDIAAHKKKKEKEKNKDFGVSKYNDEAKKGGSIYRGVEEALGLTHYEILEIVNDLARGKFSAQLTTREYLYMFAIAFDMIFKDGSYDPISDPSVSRNIKQKLFLDYYTDSIVNNFGGANAPTAGYGINFKNFAEIAFLWCIMQDGDKLREQSGIKGKPVAYVRLKTAYDIIDKCKKGSKKSAGKATASAEKEDRSSILTPEYEKNYKEKKLDTADDVVNFLLDEYNCKVSGNIMMTDHDPRRAKIKFEAMKLKTNRIFTYAVELQARSFFDSVSNFAKCFARRRDKREELVQKYCEDKGIDYNERAKSVESEDLVKHFFYSDMRVDEYIEKRVTSFARLSSLCEDDKVKKFLNKVEDRMSKCSIAASFGEEDEEAKDDAKKNAKKNAKKDAKKNAKKDDKKKAEFNPSRTNLLVLCYLQMVLLNCINRHFDQPEMMTFHDFYKKFCDGWYDVKLGKNDVIDFDKEVIIFEGANNILEDAGYQGINPKNPLDIYIIFLAYRDNCRPLCKVPTLNEVLATIKKEEKSKTI